MVRFRRRLGAAAIWESDEGQYSKVSRASSARYGAAAGGKTVTQISARLVLRSSSGRNCRRVRPCRLRRRLPHPRVFDPSGARSSCDRAAQSQIRANRLASEIARDPRAASAGDRSDAAVSRSGWKYPIFLGGGLWKVYINNAEHYRAAIRY